MGIMHEMVINLKIIKLRSIVNDVSTVVLGLWCLLENGYNAVCRTVDWDCVAQEADDSEATRL